MFSQFIFLLAIGVLYEQENGNFTNAYNPKGYLTGISSGGYDCGQQSLKDFLTNKKPIEKFHSINDNALQQKLEQYLGLANIKYFDDYNKSLELFGYVNALNQNHFFRFTKTSWEQVKYEILNNNYYTLDRIKKFIETTNNAFLYHENQRNNPTP